MAKKHTEKTGNKANSLKNLSEHLREQNDYLRRLLDELNKKDKLIRKKSSSTDK